MPPSQKPEHLKQVTIFSQAIKSQKKRSSRLTKASHSFRSKYHTLLQWEKKKNIQRIWNVSASIFTLASSVPHFTMTFSFQIDLKTGFQKIRMKYLDQPQAIPSFFLPFFPSKDPNQTPKPWFLFKGERHLLRIGNILHTRHLMFFSWVTEVTAVATDPFRLWTGPKNAKLIHSRILAANAKHALINILWRFGDQQ